MFIQDLPAEIMKMSDQHLFSDGNPVQLSGWESCGGKWNRMIPSCLW